MNKKLNKYENKNIPTPPPNRIIRESDGLPSELCNVCGSSLHRTGFLRFKTDGCIQPKCKNYYSCDKTTEGN